LEFSEDNAEHAAYFAFIRSLEKVIKEPKSKGRSKKIESDSVKELQLEQVTQATEMPAQEVSVEERGSDGEMQEEETGKQHKRQKIEASSQKESSQPEQEGKEARIKRRKINKPVTNSSPRKPRPKKS